MDDYQSNPTSRALSSREVNELILSAQERHNLRAREALLVSYAPLVKSVAARFLGSGETFEDLVQEGNLGLLSAIDFYKPEHNIQFSTYAHHLIAGQIRHYLRDRGTLIRQPAWIQEERARVEKARRGLAEELGREPSLQELAERTDLSDSRLQDILATQRMSHVLRLDIGASEESSDTVDEERLQDSSPETAVPAEERIALREALSRLKRVERKVVEDFYFGELSQTEIARRLGVSCNYVSRILKTTPQKLQAYLEEGGNAAPKTTRRLEQRLRAPDDDGVVDEPTGLYTPAYFKDRLEEELIRARRYGHSLAVLRLTVDGIPEVGKADALARSLHLAGQIVRASVRRVDILARLDKREFGVAMPYTGHDARVVGERLLSALRDNDAGFPFRGRYAIACYPDEAVTAEGLLKLSAPDLVAQEV
jgi:RNA polymerase sigma-B factor